MGDKVSQPKIVEIEICGGESFTLINSQAAYDLSYKVLSASYNNFKK